jgi:hypothetical protein
MLANISKGRALLLAAWSAAVCATSHAQQLTVPYQEVHTVADATHAVPAEHSFTVSTAGTYQVTLVDLGAAQIPSAPLASVKMALTQGNSIVGTPITAAGHIQFNAAVNTTYTIHVIGTPGTAAGSGPIEIQVIPVGGSGTPVESYSDNLAIAIGLPSDETTLDGTFTAGSTGSYAVTLADLQMPQALTTLTLLVTSNDGKLTVIPNTPLSGPGTATVNLQGGVSYRVFVVAQSDPTVDAGLFSAVITPSGGGAPVYSNVVPVGTVSQVQNVSLTAGTNYTVSLVDLGFPAALAGARAIAALNGQVVAQLTTPGTSPAFTAAAGTFQLFVLASTPSTGSYQLAVAPASGPAALNIARAVSAAGGPSAYSFDTTVTSAGSYTFGLTDFSAPAALGSLKGAVVQGGQVVGAPLNAAGTQPVTMAAGPASLLVFSQAAAAGGLFDVNLTPSAGGAALFEATQGVGQAFVARQLSITTAGSYAVNVADVGWPVPLTTFVVVATQGASQLGLVYGAGAFSFTAAAPGNYFINFIAQPGGTDGAGTYALSVAPGPVVSLNISTTNVNSGGTVTLNWSSQNADSCTASGGWSGTQLTTGTATSAPITAATTFTLTCTGEGVNAVKSQSVTVNPPTKSGGGGGAVSEGLLLALAALLAAKLTFEHLRSRGRRS